MSDELSPRARALLDAARDGMSPDAATVQRMHARIAAATGAAVAGSAASAGGTASAGSKLGAVATSKLGLIVVGAALVVGIGWYVGRSPHAPVRASAVPVPSVAAPAPRALPPPVAPAPVAPVEDPLITIEPTPRPAPRERARVVARPSEAPQAPPAAPEVAVAPREIEAPAPHAIELAREVELLDRAMASLGGGDAAGALRAVNEYAREAAGAGQLAEDAAAIEVEALCRLHDARGAQRLASFDRRFPHSAQRARLARACQATR